VSQNSIDDILVLNAGNNFNRAAAPAAGLYVNIENAFQALCPLHGCVTFSW